MASGVIVRPLNAEDYAAWLQIWNGYLEFYEATIPAEMTALTWARLLDPMVPLHGWCAEQSGKVIGFTHALEHASTWSPTPYVYLEDLFVDQSLRKSGAGSALINTVYAHADKIGSPKVYWQTAFGNETARKLYDQVGKESGFIVYQRR
jgi:GNAT superfamily N-acetyltransferase